MALSNVNSTAYDATQQIWNEIAHPVAQFLERTKQHLATRGLESQISA